MNREILFRAKRIDDREWVEGFLFSTVDHTYIAYKNQFDDDLLFSPKEIFIEVDPETVCEYTELTDEKGRRIFENDIVKFKHGGEFSDRGIWCRNYVIEYINTFCTYGLRFRNKSIHFPCKQATVSMHDVVVIGNIFDDPELLGNQVTEEG